MLPQYQTEMLVSPTTHDSTNPYSTCTVNMEEAILYDEVVCYRTCEKWQEWSKEYAPSKRE
jgi:hypothetical protein